MNCEYEQRMIQPSVLLKITHSHSCVQPATRSLARNCEWDSANEASASHSTDTRLSLYTHTVGGKSISKQLVKQVQRRRRLTKMYEPSIHTFQVCSSCYDMSLQIYLIAPCYTQSSCRMRLGICRLVEGPHSSTTKCAAAQ